MAAIPQDMRTYWRYHHVEYGDTLPSIARKYHTSTSSIAEANNLTGDEVKAGTKLIIPIAPSRTTRRPPLIRSNATHYKVRKGDTVASVADDFEVPVDKLRKWNHLRGSAADARADAGHLQAASDSAEAAARTASSAPDKPSSESQIELQSDSSQAAKYHKVKKGETLSSIAEIEPHLGGRPEAR